MLRVHSSRELDSGRPCAKAVPALIFPDTLNSLKYELRQINCFFLLFVGSLMFNGMRPHSTADYFEDGNSAPGSPQIKTKLHVPL